MRGLEGSQNSLGGGWRGTGGLLEAALGRPGASQKIVLAAWGPTWREKLVDFSLPGGPREAPGSSPGGDFGNILAARPAHTKKFKKI